MLATAPTVTNRITDHFPPAPPSVPVAPKVKQAVWGEAVLAAAMFYQSRLAHPDADAAERAARAIFDMEKTRLRHGREVAGSPATKTEDTPQIDTSRSRRDAQGAIGEGPTSDQPLMESLPDLTPIEKPGWDDVDAEVDDEPAVFDEKERAAIEAMVRHERYAPIIEEMRAKLVSQGVAEDDARRLETEAFRQHVGAAILERRGRVASRSVGGCREEHRGRRNSPRPEPANSVRELDSAQ